MKYSSHSMRKLASLLVSSSFSLSLVFTSPIQAVDSGLSETAPEAASYPPVTATAQPSSFSESLAQAEETVVTTAQEVAQTVYQEAAAAQASLQNTAESIAQTLQKDLKALAGSQDQNNTPFLKRYYGLHTMGILLLAIPAFNAFRDKQTGENTIPLLNVPYERFGFYFLDSFLTPVVLGFLLPSNWSNLKDLGKGIANLCGAEYTKTGKDGTEHIITVQETWPGHFASFKKAFYTNIVVDNLIIKNLKGYIPETTGGFQTRQFITQDKGEQTIVKKGRNGERNCKPLKILEKEQYLFDLFSSLPLKWVQFALYDFIIKDYV